MWFTGSLTRCIQREDEGVHGQLWQKLWWEDRDAGGEDWFNDSVALTPFYLGWMLVGTQLVADWSRPAIACVTVLMCPLLFHAPVGSAFAHRRKLPAVFQGVCRIQLWVHDCEFACLFCRSVDQVSLVSADQRTSLKLALPIGWKRTVKLIWDAQSALKAPQTVTHTRIINVLVLLKDT